MNANLEYERGRHDETADELDRLREKYDCLRLDLADALRLAKDYREAFERIEAELRELRKPYKEIDPFPYV
jgi:hypothetical protein